MVEVNGDGAAAFGLDGPIDFAFEDARFSWQPERRQDSSWISAWGLGAVGVGDVLDGLAERRPGNFP